MRIGFCKSDPEFSFQALGFFFTVHFWRLYLRLMYNRANFIEKQNYGF